MSHLISIIPFHYLFPGFNPELKKYQKEAKISFFIYNGLFIIGIILGIIAYTQILIITLFIFFGILTLIVRYYYVVELNTNRNKTKLNIWLRYFILNSLMFIFLFSIGILTVALIWILGSMIWLSFTILRLIRDHFFKETLNKSWALTHLVVCLSFIIYPLGIGKINISTVSSIYSVIITGSFTIIAILFAFGTYLSTRKNETKVEEGKLQKKSKRSNNKSSLKLIKGIILINILVVVISLIGLITLNSSSNTYFDLSIDSLIPKEDITNRVFPSFNTMFCYAILIFTVGTVLCGIGYLYPISEEIFKI